MTLPTPDDILTQVKPIDKDYRDLEEAEHIKEATKIAYRCVAKELRRIFDSSVIDIDELNKLVKQLEDGKKVKR